MGLVGLFGVKAGFFDREFDFEVGDVCGSTLEREVDSPVERFSKVVWVEHDGCKKIGGFGDMSG